MQELQTWERRSMAGEMQEHGDAEPAGMENHDEGCRSRNVGAQGMVMQSGRWGFGDALPTQSRKQRSKDPPTPRPHLRGGCTYRCPRAPQCRWLRGLHRRAGGCGRARERQPPGWARGAHPHRWMGSWRASCSGTAPTLPAPAGLPVPGSPCSAAAPSAHHAAPRRPPHLRRGHTGGSHTPRGPHTPRTPPTPHLSPCGGGRRACVCAGG